MRIGNEKIVGNYTNIVHNLTNMVLYMNPHDIIIQNINSFPHIYFDMCYIMMLDVQERFYYISFNLFF